MPAKIGIRSLLAMIEEQEADHGVTFNVASGPRAEIVCFAKHLPDGDGKQHRCIFEHGDQVVAHRRNDGWNCLG